MCSWWARRSPGCVREHSPGGHLSKEWACYAPPAEAQLPILLFREQNMSQRPGFFYRLIERFHSFGYTGGSVPAAAVRLPAASDQSGSLKSWVLSLRGCNNKGPFPSASVNRTSGLRAPFLARCRDVHRQMIRVGLGQPIAVSSGCCPRSRLWQLDSALTREHGSTAELRDFVKCAAHQNARAAPAEVSHPLLAMALLAPPVTCELGNERRGGAVIYITNVRVRRTWTPLISPCLISLSDQMGMHNTSDGQ